MRPTLDELDDFFSGRADEETRYRIGSELLDLESPLRLFVEGARSRAERLTGWIGTDDGDEGILEKIQATLLERNRVSITRWIAYFLTHVSFWVVWIEPLAIILAALFMPRSQGSFHFATWLASIVCVVGCATDLSVALSRRRPSAGTLWEAIAGGIATIGVFVIGGLGVMVTLQSAGLGMYMDSVMRWVVLATGPATFLGSLTGVTTGFGVRGMVQTGRLTMKELPIRCGLLTFAHSGAGWILAIIVAVCAGFVQGEVVLYGLTIVVAMINTLSWWGKEVKRSEYLRIALASLAGAIIGCGFGTIFRLLMPTVGVAFGEWALGAGWFLGSVSCANALWFGYRNWEKKFVVVVRVFVALVLANLIIAIISQLLSMFGSLYILSLPWWTFLAVLVPAYAVGAYLGWTGSWLAVVPSGLRLSCSRRWTHWTAGGDQEDAPGTRLGVVTQIIVSPAAGVLRTYGSMVDTFVSLWCKMLLAINVG